MSADTRARLLEAAERILIEQGVHALTVRRIGSLSALNPTLVTYHFGTTAGLLTELCRLNLQPMIAEWEGLEAVAGAGLDAVLVAWLRPLTRAAAFSENGRALIVLDEIAAHGQREISAHLLATMVAVSARVRALLQPRLPHLDGHALRARLRFISGAVLGPPPRTRSLASDDGGPPLDAFASLLAFARAALLG